MWILAYLLWLPVSAALVTALLIATDLAGPPWGGLAFILWCWMVYAPAKWLNESGR